MKREPGSAPAREVPARGVAVIVWAVREPWLVRSASGVVDVFGAAARLLAAGRSLADAIHPDDRVAFAAALRGLVRTDGDAAEHVFRLRAAEDLTAPAVRAIIVPDRNAGGFVNCFRGYFVALPPRVPADPASLPPAVGAAGASLPDVLRRMIDAVPDVIFAKDTHSRYTEGNRAVRALLTGDPERSIAGLDDDVYFTPEEAERNRASDREVLAGRGPHRGVSQVTTVAGVRCIETVKSAIEGADGSIHGLVGVARDVTERVAAERDLLQARETARAAADAATRAKSAFVANVIHEIRSPLNGMLGLAQRLEATLLEDVQREYVTQILESGRSLLALTTDILDLSTIEDGRLTLERLPFRLRDLVDDCVRGAAPDAAEKGLEIGSTIDSSVPEVVFGDAPRLRQVLANLVGNGVRFTASGAVTVIGTVARGDGETRLMLAVEDTGPGIAPEQQAHIFEAFAQGDGPAVRRSGGNGLGLSIAARLVALMGGQIEVESSPGRGSTFFVWIPIEVGAAPDPAVAPLPAVSARAADVGTGAGAEPAAADVPRATAPHPLRLLLADDNAIHRHLATRLLERRGHTVVAVADGAAAVQAAAAGRFDVILMDVHMPGLDGLDAARAIRAAEGVARHTPIIALTVLAMTGDREACLAAGMDDYVSKPIDPAALFRCIECLLACVP